jgi:hypothetical protein
MIAGARYHEGPVNPVTVVLFLSSYPLAIECSIVAKIVQQNVTNKDPDLACWKEKKSGVDFPPALRMSGQI